ncbi:hypothetical protein G5A69_00395 [Ralstonia mannitolilytica]|nr:hypothetical protein G5A69_00395 [Ralstonia mannitolilytica]
MAIAKAESEPTWPQLPLPYGPGDNLIVAHTFVRSGIFSTQLYRRHAERPVYLRKTALATTETSDIRVFQTRGPRLDQGDADVFYELLRRVFDRGRESDREEWIRLNRSELLDALGRGRGGKTRRLLDESLDRLCRAEFDFVVPGLLAGRLRLIRKMRRPDGDDATDCDYEVLLDSDIARLFECGQWTLLRQAERCQLAGSPLARGLHALYASLSEPYPMKASTLKNLMGRVDAGKQMAPSAPDRTRCSEASYRVDYLRVAGNQHGRLEGCRGEGDGSEDAKAKFRCQADQAPCGR